MKKWVCFYIVINILLLRENLPLEIVGKVGVDVKAVINMIIIE